MSYTKIDNESLQNTETFWKEQAENLEWFTFPKTIHSRDEDGLTPPSTIEDMSVLGELDGLMKLKKVGNIST